MLRFLWWIVLSALYCLRAWWMKVPWKQERRFLGRGSFFLAKMLQMSTFKNRKNHTIILEFGRDLNLGALEKVNMDQGKALRERTSAWPYPETNKQVISSVHHFTLIVNMDKWGKHMPPKKHRPMILGTRFRLQNDQKKCVPNILRHFLGRWFLDKWSSGPC